MMARRKYKTERQYPHNPTTPSNTEFKEIGKKILEKIRIQPQAWQVLWSECGMPQPASVFKTVLKKLVDQKRVYLKFISGNKYYFKR